MKSYNNSLYILFVLFALPFGLYAQTATHNYVQEITPKQAYTAGNQIPANNPQSATHMVQYVDGLGRPLQQVLNRQSPAQKDMVIPFAYDAWGRETHKYLPYVSTSDNATLQNTWSTDQGNFYGSPTGMVPQSQYPFNRTLFDQSPLNETVAAWQPVPAAVSGSGTPVKINRRANAASDYVLSWIYDHQLNRPRSFQQLNHSLGQHICTVSFYNTGCNASYNSAQLFNHGQSTIPVLPQAAPNDDISYGLYYPIQTPQNPNAFTLQHNVSAGTYLVSFYVRKYSSQSVSSLQVTDKVTNQTLLVVNTASAQAWTRYTVQVTTVNLINLEFSGINGQWNNVNDIVLLDEVSIDELVQTTATQTPEYYAPGSLIVIETTDEDNLKKLEFKNYLGQTILQRVQAPGNTWLETYYVYNVQNQLATTLPPRLVQQLAGNSYSLTSPVNLFEQYAFNYIYDERKRPIIVKLPDGVWHETVYDINDRVVLTRDNNLRAQNKWLFTKYTAGEQVAYTGIYTDASKTRAQLQADANANTLLAETFAPSGVYYTTQAFPSTQLDILTANYYGTYDLNQDGNPDWNFSQVNGLNLSNITSRIHNLPTVAKARISGTSQWVTTVNYYDKDGRLAVTYTENGNGGYTLDAFTYDFTGLKLTEKSWNKAEASSNEQVYEKMFAYDHANRLVHTHLKAPGATDFVLIQEMKYNPIGMPHTKNVHTVQSSYSPLERMNFKYDIRNRLLAVNDVDQPGVRLFSLEYRFEEALTHTNIGGTVTATPRLNGNISSQRWKSKRDNCTRGFAYTYDEANRITQAAYFGHNPGNTVSENGRYTATNMSYDANGNLLAMHHSGLLSATGTPAYASIDQLSYTYSGNRLLAVTDAAALTGLNDFQDGHVQGTDYTYDGNGNLTSDANKGITAITWNHQNLPTQITFANGNQLTHSYDASGKKRSTTFTSSTAPGYTLCYNGACVYKDGVLQSLQHEEGRLVNVALPGNPQQLEYHYDYRDHLGNVRLTYTPTLQTESWGYGYELSEAGQVFIPGIGQPYDGDNPKFMNALAPIQADDSPYQGLYSGKVTSENGTYTEINVEPGDTITAQVMALAQAPPENQTPGNNWLFTLLGLNPDHFAPNGEGGYTQTAGPAALINLGGIAQQLVNLLSQNNTPQLPGALVMRELDAQGQVLAIQAHPALYTGVWTAVGGSLVITNPNTRRVQVMATASNGSTVYYDNFTVGRTRLKPVIVQENHYQPYGLNIKGLEYTATPVKNTQQLFGGKELVNETQLEWNDFGARMLDPQIGRWVSVDPLALTFAQVSPYNAMNSNPIRFADPTGAAPQDWVKTEEGKMLWDDRVTNQATANQFYGSGAKYLAPGSNYCSNGNDVLLGNNGNYSINGVQMKSINATPDIVGADIMSKGWGRFIFYYEQLGQSYFYNAANRNFNDNASGVMKFIVTNYPGAEEATRLSQMTHRWVDGPSGTEFTEERNKLEHQIGMFIIAEKYGKSTALDIGRMNEYRGFWFNDRHNGKMLNSLMGRGNTAFQWSDLKHNYEGIDKWEKYNGLNLLYKDQNFLSEFNIFK